MSTDFASNVVVLEGSSVVDSSAAVLAHVVNAAGDLEALQTSVVAEAFVSAANEYANTGGFGALALGQALVIGVEDEGKFVANLVAQGADGVDAKAFEGALYEAVEEMRELGVNHIAVTIEGADNTADLLDSLNSEAEVNPDFLFEVYVA